MGFSLVGHVSFFSPAPSFKFRAHVRRRVSKKWISLDNNNNHNKLILFGKLKSHLKSDPDWSQGNTSKIIFILLSDWPHNLNIGPNYQGPMKTNEA